MKNIIRKWKTQLNDGVKSLPAQVLAGAAGACGIGLYALVSLGMDWTFDRLTAEKMVGILSQPDQPAVPVVDDTNAQGEKACRPRVSIENITFRTGNATPEIENWKVRNLGGNKIESPIANTDGVGQGQVVGYRKPVDGSNHNETIYAGFDGATAGKGYYALEKGSKDRWWHGTNTYYDCDIGITFKCPYVLGGPSLQAEMSQDPWLKKPCMPELLPSNEARLQAAKQRQAAAAPKDSPRSD